MLHSVSAHDADSDEVFHTAELTEKAILVLSMFDDWSSCEVSELAAGLTIELQIRRMTKKAIAETAP